MAVLVCIHGLMSSVLHINEDRRVQSESESEYLPQNLTSIVFKYRVSVPALDARVV